MWRWAASFGQRVTRSQSVCYPTNRTRKTLALLYARVCDSWKARRKKTGNYRIEPFTQLATTQFGP
jgi:hypothetical protein